MKKVLVIGGAGYIGSHVVLELLDQNFEVVVLDNLSTGHKELVPKGVKLYVGDITNYDDLKEVFKTEKVDAVMDFAAKIVVPESVKEPLSYYHNNLEGVRLILEAMVEFGVKHLVFSSTAAVYGEPENGVCQEDDLKIPINPYGESKLAAENLIKWSSKAYDLDYVIFRYFNVAGADSRLRSGLISDKLTHIVPIITESMLGYRGPISVFGFDYPTPDGTCIRDYIHVTDLAIAHIEGLKYLLNGNKSAEINLGSNAGYSVLELVNEANTISKLSYTKGPRREGDPAVLIASNKRAKKLLNWEPTRNLKEIIKSDYEFRKTRKK
ncbi:MAG: UDP-glucose 4-epimerase GalE [Acholeplasmataceae bacterium]|nr:UDP-glucose 4-epimerase GalE [Acholeplasmataceae bacterium]